MKKWYTAVGAALCRNSVERRKMYKKYRTKATVDNKSEIGTLKRYGKGLDEARQCLRIWTNLVINVVPRWSTTLAYLFVPFKYNLQLVQIHFTNWLIDLFRIFAFFMRGAGLCSIFGRKRRKRCIHSSHWKIIVQKTNGLFCLWDIINGDCMDCMCCRDEEESVLELVQLFGAFAHLSL